MPTGQSDAGSSLFEISFSQETVSSIKLTAEANYDSPLSFFFLPPSDLLARLRQIVKSTRPQADRTVSQNKPLRHLLSSHGTTTSFQNCVRQEYKYPACWYCFGFCC